MKLASGVVCLVLLLLAAFGFHPAAFLISGVAFGAIGLIFLYSLLEKFAGDDEEAAIGIVSSAAALGAIIWMPDFRFFVGVIILALSSVNLIYYD